MKYKRNNVCLWIRNTFVPLLHRKDLTTSVVRRRNKRADLGWESAATGVVNVSILNSVLEVLAGQYAAVTVSVMPGVRRH